MTETEHNGVVAVQAAETSKDARQLLADITAGLEGVTPGPWKFDGTSITDWGREWEASMSMEFIPNGTNGDGINERYEKDGTHIDRCDPDTMRTIDREFTALTLELAAAKQRIAELEAERQWQPIDEEAKTGRKIIALENFTHEWMDDDGDIKTQIGDCEVVRWNKAREAWTSFGMILESFEPTHYMPLPASPQ